MCVNYPSDMKACVCIVKRYCRRINVLQNAPLSLSIFFFNHSSPTPLFSMCPLDSAVCMLEYAIHSI